MGLPISKINIALQTAGATRAGFGVPNFFTATKAFFSRTQTYTGTDGVAEVFTTSHPAYKFASGIYSNTPSVDKIMVSRKETPSVTLTPEDATAGKLYTVKVTLEDDTFVLATYTATGTEVASDIVTDILSDLSSLTDITLSGTDTVVISDNTQKCTVTEISGFTETYTSSETAADTMSAVREENDDFYFVQTDDHTEAYVLAMAAVVQSLKKLYAVSLQEAENLTTAYSVAGTSIAAQLKQGNYSRTFGIWDEEADTLYPESHWVGHNAPYSPDIRAIVWSGNELSGVSVAKNASGNETTTTQQGNLDSYNLSYVATTSLGPRVIGGKTFSGTWIDEMRIQDCIEARIRERLDTLILNQKGSKLVGGAAGIALAKGAVEKALQPFVGSKALRSYEVFTTNATVDPVTRILSGLEFVAVLEGAILQAVVDGTLVNQEV